MPSTDDQPPYSGKGSLGSCSSYENDAENVDGNSSTIVVRTLT